MEYAATILVICIAHTVCLLSSKFPYMHIWIQILHTCMLACMYAHIYTYVNTYIHTYIHTQPYIHSYTHTHIHTRIRTYIHTYINTYIHTYIHTFYIIWIQNSVAVLTDAEAVIKHAIFNTKKIKSFTYIMIMFD